MLRWRAHILPEARCELIPLVPGVFPGAICEVIHWFPVYSRALLANWILWVYGAPKGMAGASFELNPWLSGASFCLRGEGGWHYREIQFIILYFRVVGGLREAHSSYLALSTSGRKFAEAS